MKRILSLVILAGAFVALAHQEKKKYRSERSENEDFDSVAYRSHFPRGVERAHHTKHACPMKEGCHHLNENPESEYTRQGRINLDKIIGRHQFGYGGYENVDRDYGYRGVPSFGKKYDQKII